eukprot:CAMPEP_0185025954 /NCGR_PEP_ID=MMETSP1103-20130426/9482_1 /TAXON_ID=36769 /ORGANISM="Paraphysomonas bandaiensis, Strain Caron Lab Isolate" /LENGTH=32 /DNA_ID= /DNA_START= /DNA_END= /DNA_ORIENTATION=
MAENIISDTSTIVMMSAIDPYNLAKYDINVVV